MKRILAFIMAYIVGIGIADAAVRDGVSISRTTNITHNTTNSRQTSSRTTTSRTTVAPQRTTATVSRARTTSAPRANRSTNISRATVTTGNTKSVSRAPTKNIVRTATNTSRPTRAATLSATQSNTFGTGYNACRDAYFTCMDQFCATQNDTYRRCACSSRLNQIKSRENLLSDTANQIQDFKSLNLSVITKSPAEVNAMLSPTSGEATATTAHDTSASAMQLANISSVLADAKSKSLSMSGTLDIGGDIGQIWQTTDLTDGANIANLTGEALYNAVHAQCSQMVASTCNSTSTLNMVVSAYGMYIENDCTTLMNSLDSQTTAAKGTVRETERDMHNARLENYNAHNSTSIHDCIASVRADLTATSACGPDYVHCLDVTGRYLNRDTGEPIYTTDFYQLNTQTSLSGNILTNPTNRLIVAELNRMRPFAAASLDTCRDLADDVWDEFVRQAITEIYQGQQERIRTVKNECLDIVNACYDEKNHSLKDFSNVSEQLLLGQRLELSEELCREKLETCSNLYGGGTDGLDTLVNTMHNLTDSKIAKACRVTLQDYARNICAVPGNDTLHKYPYACRVYAPGAQTHAQNPVCNQQLWSKDNIMAGQNTSTDTDTNTPTTGYVCEEMRIYTSCNTGYYLNNNKCIKCSDDCDCPGDTAAQTCDTPDNQPEPTPDPGCGDYPGSLYQRLVRYAMQTCVRPSQAGQPDYVIPTDILQDINVVMDSIRADMGTALATECERLGGTWVDTKWIDKGLDKEHAITGHLQYKQFYDETGANTDWGYCTASYDLPDICVSLGGKWIPIEDEKWEDTKKNEYCCAYGTCITGDGSDGVDGCDDNTGNVLLTEFYFATLATTNTGYCAEPH